MEFPWRCNVDSIAMDLKVSWEMSAKVYFGAASVFTNRPIVLKPLKNSHPVNLHGNIFLDKRTFLIY